jgi:CHASE3 domain sensor protein
MPKKSSAPTKSVAKKRVTKKVKTTSNKNFNFFLVLLAGFIIIATFILRVF